MPKKIECIGLRYGKLTVISEISETGKRRKVVCVCDCGNETITDPRWLFMGDTKSCGCIQKQAVSRSCIERNTKHGMIKTKAYRAWTALKGRCENPKNKKYPDYGFRGIKVCDGWKNSFDKFLDDMGQPPSPNHSIDRIDVNGDYSPENCRWATPMEQANNKRNSKMVELDGCIMTLSEACRKAGVNYRSALYRFNNKKNWMPLPTAPTPPEN